MSCLLSKLPFFGKKKEAIIEEPIVIDDKVLHFQHQISAEVELAKTQLKEFVISPPQMTLSEYSNIIHYFITAKLTKPVLSSMLEAATQVDSNDYAYEVKYDDLRNQIRLCIMDIYAQLEKFFGGKPSRIDTKYLSLAGIVSYYTNSGAVLCSVEHMGLDEIDAVELAEHGSYVLENETYYLLFHRCFNDGSKIQILSKVVDPYRESYVRTIKDDKVSKWVLWEEDMTVPLPDMYRYLSSIRPS